MEEFNMKSREYITICGNHSIKVREYAYSAAVFYLGDKQILREGMTVYLKRTVTTPKGITILDSDALTVMEIRSEEIDPNTLLHSQRVIKVRLPDGKFLKVTILSLRIAHPSNKWITVTKSDKLYTVSPSKFYIIGIKHKNEAGTFLRHLDEVALKVQVRTTTGDKLINKSEVGSVINIKADLVENKPPQIILKFSLDRYASVTYNQIQRL